MGKIANLIKKPEGLFLLFSGLTLLVYIPSINGPFIYDDLGQIVENLHLHDISRLKEVIFCGLRQIRVIQNMTFALNWTLGPGQTFGFKVFNLGLHLVNGFLVFRFLRKILPQSQFIYLFATATFLLHPLQLQSVTYVMGRISLIETFFRLVILNLISDKNEKPFLTFLLLILSYLGKESNVIIPFLIVFFYLTIGKMDFKDLPPKKIVLYFFSLLFFVPLYFILRDPVSMYDGTVGFSLYPPFQYFLIQFYNYFFYLFLFFNPYHQSIFHPFPIFSLTIGILGLIAFLMALGILWMAFKKRKEWPILTFFVFYFFSSLSLTNTALQMINPFAEYRLYSANLSLAVITALLINKIIERTNFRRTIYFASACLLTFWIIFNYSLNTVWANPTSIVTYGYNLYPDSATMAGMAGDQAFFKGNYQEAARYFQAADSNNQKEHIKTLRYKFNLANSYLKGENFNQANEVLNDLISKMAGQRPPRDYFIVKLSVLRSLGRNFDDDEYKKVFADGLKYYGSDFLK